MDVKLKIFLTVLLVYLFYIAPDYTSANTNRYTDLVKAVVDDKTFAIDKYYKNTRDWGVYGTHHYIGAAPGLGFMAMPIYMVTKPIMKLIPTTVYDTYEFSILNAFFTFFLAVLPGAVISVLLFGILSKLDMLKKEKILVIFGSSFGTMLFYYSTRFMSPVMGAFTLFAAFYIFFMARHASVKRYQYFLAGLLLGAAVLIDYILVIGSALILIYYLTYFRKADFLNHCLVAFGIIPMAALYMYYHFRCFDNPFVMATTYSQMIGPHAVSWPKMRTIAELAFGTYRGLFLYAPITGLSVYGIYRFFIKPDKKYIGEVLLVSVFSILVFILISGYRAWDGGGDFGPRYFVSFLPFLMIPLAFSFKRVGYKIIFWVTSLSVFINWCGVQYGDADSVFTDILLFLSMGLNSNLAEWAYKLASTHMRQFNVITHFSPFMGFIILMGAIYLIWKDEEWVKAARR